MTRAVLIVVLTFSCSSHKGDGYAQGGAVSSDETVALSYKKAWEPNWPSSWRLLDVSKKGVDHFKVGYVLRWQRDEGNQRTIRTDAFSTDGAYLWGSEELSQEGHVRFRGGVVLERGVGLKYRNLVEMPPDDRTDAGPAVSAYRLEVYDRGRLVSIYQAQDTFVVSQRELVPKRVPSDAVPIFGTRVSEVERAKVR